MPIFPENRLSRKPTAKSRGSKSNATLTLAIPTNLMQRKLSVGVWFARGEVSGKLGARDSVRRDGTAAYEEARGSS